MASTVFDTSKIYDIIYKMAYDANIYLPHCVYEKIKNCTLDKTVKNQILKNAYLAQIKKRPLCQDCGQVVVFLEVGQNISLNGEFIDDVINKAVSDCYIDNYFRKSIVKDALLNRNNTKTNTPVIIEHKIIKEDKIKILLFLKGGGSENTTQIKMFNPTATGGDIKEFVKDAALNAIKYACPPISVGVGAGGVLDTACHLSKLALFEGENYDLDLDNVFDSKILTTSTHIANLPVCVSINCHSARYSKAEIDSFGNVSYKKEDFTPGAVETDNNYKKLNTNNLEEFKNLKTGDKISLTGTIYTARDMAHQRLEKMIKNGEKLPIEIKNSFIFFAGPAPKKEDEIIGPIGPTTSKRMDKFQEIMYKNGMFATIGKGERTINKGLYFTVTGGVACLLQDCIKSATLVAFEDLGPEAIYKLEIEDMPLTVNYKE